MFIVKMEGFAGFVGLMFGLVVLSVIISVPLKWDELNN